MAALEGADDVTALTTTKSSLLNLPAELRNEIYSLALISDALLETSTQYQLIERRGSFGAYYMRISLRVPSLLQTSRQIRAETLAIFYGANTFKFHTHRPRRLDVSELLRPFGPFSRRIPLLRNIQIKTKLATYALDLASPTGTGRVVVNLDEINCYLCTPGIVQDGFCRDQSRKLRLAEAQTAVEAVLSARGSMEGIDEATLVSIFGEVV